VIETSGDAKKAAMVEVNCETDFVAKDDNFQKFAKEVASIVLTHTPADLDALLGTKMQTGDSVQDSIKGLIAKIGENMSVRRFVLVESSAGTIGSYSHGSRIGVLVNMEGGDGELAKDIAMHIAASKPECVSAEQVPAELIDKEKEIFSAQAAESGKPADIIEKMVSGRINKYLKEITLLGQPFVKDPDTTIEKLLKSKNATVVAFNRFEVGEGIEKKQENFADEVMAQVKGS
jgi:elongation factor Ts